MDIGVDIHTPVVLIMFNRPECTKEVFSKISCVKPKELFIISDAPREGNADDIRLCRQCREIVKRIDWPCSVQRNYATHNMGCGERISSGLSWVFSQVERAIILEDDCVPSPSFFRFCQELLELYQSDERVYSVCGTNYLISNDTGADYYFSHYFSPWGWATWRRVWERYSYQITTFPDVKKNDTLRPMIVVPDFLDYWYRIFEDLYEGRWTDDKSKSAWSYQFYYLSMTNNGVHIYPNKNLVANIGYGEQATHTLLVDPDEWEYSSTRVAYDVNFPLRHVKQVQADFKMDYLMMDKIYIGKTLGSKVRESLSEEIGKLKENSSIIIYGAGTVCREVIKFLGDNGIDTFSIAVTKLENASQYVMGVQVHSIEEYLNTKEKGLVIVSVTARYRDAVKENLLRLGFNNYIMALR